MEHHGETGLEDRQTMNLPCPLPQHARPREKDKILVDWTFVLTIQEDGSLSEIVSSEESPQTS